MKTLKEFFALYVEWIDNGAPSPHMFTGLGGLCYNLERYSCVDAADVADVGWTIEQSRAAQLTAERLRNQLSTLLKQRTGSDYLPFNRSFSHFSRESDAVSCHLNPERIAFVRQNLQG